ncbi:MAG: hypothetical protein IPM32_13140 [Ignavibacteriae bacterium]|nr:hypothetical protein [Ignavibacteriota bacterium]
MHILLAIVLYISSISFAQNSIQHDNFNIISPINNQVFSSGKRESILWYSSETILLDIEYSENINNWVKIFNNINSDISYIGWKVPNNLSQKTISLRIINSHTGKIVGIRKNIFIQNNFKSIELQKSNSNSKKLKILPLGNSITFDKRSRQTDFRIPEDRTGYRLPLFVLLTNRGITFDFIGSEHAGSNFLPLGFEENAGFPGIRDSQLTNLLQSGILNMNQYGIYDTLTIGPYLETYLPDIILLHIGTNGNEQLDGIFSIDEEEILDEIARVENKLAKPINVIFSRIIDRSPNKNFVNTFNNNVENMILDRVYNPLNNAYPDLIHMVDMEDSAKIIYEIDIMGTIGNGINGDMNDELHPNNKGYAKMAKVWFDGIINILPKLNARVFLEGAYSGLSNMQSNNNFFVTIPHDQPFKLFPWYFDGTEHVAQIPENVIDWVLVSLRSGETKSSTKAQRAGFIKENGTIVDLDGESPLAFVVDEGSYYVVVEHRNHLPIMSSEKVLIQP